MAINLERRKGISVSVPSSNRMRTEVLPNAGHDNPKRDNESEIRFRMGIESVQRVRPYEGVTVMTGCYVIASGAGRALER